MNTESHTPLTIVPSVIPFKNGNQGSLDVRLAERWGCQPTTAHSRRYQLAAQCVDVIEELRIAHDAEALAAFTAPLIAALSEDGHGDLRQAQRDYDAADATEDQCQIAWIFDHSDDALDAYIRKMTTEIRAGERLLAELVTERQRRKDAK